MSVEQPLPPTSSDIPQQSNPWVPGAGVPAVPTSSQAAGHAPPPATGPIGQVRGTGVCMLLAVVTLGIYALVWFYKTHEEMKRHTGQGLGGTIALVIAIFVGIASPFLTSNEVGSMYERRGQAKPVTGLTGLWYFPGVFLLVGPFVWFIKTNGALNAYWRSVGAH
jgi:hypothetical protein